MVVGFDFDDPAADAIDQERHPDQIWRNLMDAAVEEAFAELFADAFAGLFGRAAGFAFVHCPSSQAALELANTGVASLLVNAHLTGIRKRPSILWPGGNSLGTFQRIIFQDASRRFLAIGFFETIGCGGQTEFNAAACFRFQSASAF